MTARAGCPRCSTGLRGPARPVAHRVVARRHRQQGRQRRPARRDAFGATRRRAARLDGVPRRRARRARAPRPTGADTEWVWLLHDDANPPPDALAALLAAAAADPDADVLGPKLREWPSLQRLLELGVTISGTGRRETGLERGEYDQGQHDDVRHVLAVNTAGMLVRRRGARGARRPRRRAADLRQRHRLRLARRRGRPPDRRRARRPWSSTPRRRTAALRRTPLTGAAHPLPGAPRRAVHPARQLPVARLPLAGRPAGVRDPAPDARLPARSARRGQALDDLAALLSVVRAARASSCARPAGPARRGHGRPGRRPAGCWRRAGCPTGTGSTSSATSRPRSPSQAPDVAERRRAAAAERDPSSFAARRTAERERLEDEEVAEDTGLVARFLTNPVAVLLALVVVLAMLVGARAALGHVSGGGLSPAPDARRRLVAPAPRVLARARARHRGARAAVRAADGAAGHRCSAAARPRRCRRCWCWRCPFALWGAWRLPARGRAGSRRPAGAHRWLILWGVDDLRAGRRSPPAPGARAGSALVLVGRAAALARRTPPSASPTRSPTAAGGRPGAPGCCSPWSLRSRRSPGWSPPWSAWSWWLLAFTLLPGVGRDRSAWGPPVVRWPWCRCCSRRGGSPRCVHGAGEGLLLDGGPLPAPTPDGADLRAGPAPRPRRAVVARASCCRARGAGAGAAPDPDPGAHLLGGRAGRGPGGRRARRRSRSTWPRCRAAPGLGFLLVVAAGGARDRGRRSARSGSGPPHGAAAPAGAVAARRGRASSCRWAGWRWFVLDGRRPPDAATATPASRRTWCRAPSSARSTASSWSAADWRTG